MEGSRGGNTLFVLFSGASPLRRLLVILVVACVFSPPPRSPVLVRSDADSAPQYSQSHALQQMLQSSERPYVRGRAEAGRPGRVRRATTSTGPKIHEVCGIDGSCWAWQIEWSGGGSRVVFEQHESILGPCLHGKCPPIRLCSGSGECAPELPGTQTPIVR
jgi:hypothetical protein